LHLFSRNGFSGTPVRDIARGVGITDAAIYYHFRTKEDLLHALVSAELRPCRASRRQRPDKTLRETLRTIGWRAAEVIHVNHDLLVTVLREGLAGDAAAASRYRELIDGWESRITARLVAFEQTGALAAGAAQPLARQMIWTITSAFVDMLLPRRDLALSPAERRRWMDEFVLERLERMLPLAFAD
jgi:AcrR family transcriptional regulator